MGEPAVQARASLLRQHRGPLAKGAAGRRHGAKTLRSGQRGHITELRAARRVGHLDDASLAAADPHPVHVGERPKELLVFEPVQNGFFRSRDGGHGFLYKVETASDSAGFGRESASDLGLKSGRISRQFERRGNSFGARLEA